MHCHAVARGSLCRSVVVPQCSVIGILYTQCGPLVGVLVGGVADRHGVPSSERTRHGSLPLALVSCCSAQARSGDSPLGVDSGVCRFRKNNSNSNGNGKP